MQLLAEPAAPMAPIFVTVRSVEEELQHTFTLELDAPPGFSFAPGQFTMLYAFGVGDEGRSTDNLLPGNDPLKHIRRDRHPVAGLIRCRRFRICL